MHGAIVAAIVAATIAPCMRPISDVCYVYVCVVFHVHIFNIAYLLVKYSYSSHLYRHCNWSRGSGVPLPSCALRYASARKVCVAAAVVAETFISPAELP